MGGTVKAMGRGDECRAASTPSGVGSPGWNRCQQRNSLIGVWTVMARPVLFYWKRLGWHGGSEAGGAWGCIGRSWMLAEGRDVVVLVQIFYYVSC